MAENNKQPLRANGTHPSQQMLRSHPQNANKHLQPFGVYPNRFIPNRAGGYSLDEESLQWHEDNK